MDRSLRLHLPRLGLGMIVHPPVISSLSLLRWPTCCSPSGPTARSTSGESSSVWPGLVELISLVISAIPAIIIACIRSSETGVVMKDQSKDSEVCPPLPLHGLETFYLEVVAP